MITGIVQLRLRTHLRCHILAAPLVALAALGSTANAQEVAAAESVETTLRDRKDSVELGLSWLAQHQATDGSWDADGFMHPKLEGESNCACEGTGKANQDVGVTGLCLLALLGQNEAANDGPYKRNIASAARWLQDQQDAETGLIGQRAGFSSAYDHAIASLALAEYQLAAKDESLLTTLEQSTAFIQRARNPYGAWRYDIPPLGQNDTSVTGWMVFALNAAEKCGVDVDKDAYVGALSWIDEATDPKTARVGYDSSGSVSARVPGINDQYPADSGEAMTAIGMLCRFVMGEYPRKKALLERHAQLLLRSLPVWDPKSFGCDMYYWYFGSHAMAQVGGYQWESWSNAIRPTLIGAQHTEGHQAGSWDPLGPWGYSGGRPYATALMVLCLEVE